MTLTGILKTLAMPPVSLLLLALAGLLLAIRWRRLGWGISLLAITLLLVLAMPITGAVMLARLSADLPRTPPATQLPAAVVILSAEARAVNTARTRFEPGPLTWERLLAGAVLARGTRLPILVSGGPVGSDTSADSPTLAMIMAVALTQQLNMAPRWREARSRDTWENARYSAEILREAGITSVYLVSHGWHLRRAGAAFRQFGITVTAVPVRPDPWPAFQLEEFVPSLAGWQASFYGLHEWIGGLYYAWRT